MLSDICFVDIRRECELTSFLWFGNVMCALLSFISQCQYSRLMLRIRQRLKVGNGVVVAGEKRSGQGRIAVGRRVVTPAGTSAASATAKVRRTTRCWLPATVQVSPCPVSMRNARRQLWWRRMPFRSKYARKHHFVGIRCCSISLFMFIDKHYHLFLICYLSQVCFIIFLYNNVWYYIF